MYSSIPKCRSNDPLGKITGPISKKLEYEFKMPPEEISVLIAEKKFDDLLPFLALRTRVGLTLSKEPSGCYRIQVFNIARALNGSEVTPELIEKIRNRLIQAVIASGHKPIDKKTMEAAE